MYLCLQKLMGMLIIGARTFELLANILAKNHGAQIYTEYICH